MPRPDLSRVAHPFHKYIKQVPQDDLLPAIRELGDDCISFMKNIPADKYDYAYAPGKWTLKEVLQHIIDAERIFCFRALSFARKEQQPLPGFEENDYTAASKAASRNWNDLVEEFAIVRKGTEYLFASFDKEQLNADGISNNSPNYVSGLGFIIAGHCQHHLNVIKERYF
jgi:hypothetical protein